MWKYNDKRIQEGVAWSDDYGTQHPANWHLWSYEEKLAHGLVWVEQTERPDERFYNISDNWDGTFSATPKNLENLINKYVSEAKQRANQSLKDTDWYFIAKVERNKDIPLEVLEYRSTIISACSTVENLYKNCTSLEEFIIAVNSANDKWTIKKNG